MTTPISSTTPPTQSGRGHPTHRLLSHLLHISTTTQPLLQTTITMQWVKSRPLHKQSSGSMQALDLQINLQHRLPHLETLRQQILPLQVLQQVDLAMFLHQDLTMIHQANLPTLLQVGQVLFQQADQPLMCISPPLQM